MPLISIDMLDARTDTRLASWRITETAADFLDSLHIVGVDRDRFLGMYKSETRRREVLAVRLLLSSLFGVDVALYHDADGRPLLDNGFNISISHTKDFAVVLVSRSRCVSVDTEYLNPRVLRITDKFLRADEKAENLLETMLHWCAKETIYKYYPDDHLAFADMRIKAVNGDIHEGIISAENMTRSDEVSINYKVEGEIVVTYMLS